MPYGSLIGRERELDELERRTRQQRLVTVVGPGGVGKTALAVALAERVGDSFPLGVRHVDLTRIDDERAVRGTLAAQLGFDSFDGLLSSPNDRPLLLVVDNCEHLLDATAQALVEVLGACQQPTVLATSRSPLELPGESVLSLPPLAMPGLDDDPVACPSVRLFLERCRDAGASLDDVDVPDVVNLCRLLDGLPLALEIAAARARTMTITEIAARLAEGVDVLDRPRYRGDPRHRSVTETIRWSYDLLSPDAAELLERLAVFSGSFSTAMAEALVDAAGRFDADLDELLSASLVSADTSGREVTYRLLGTVRLFALDRLRRHERMTETYNVLVDHVIATAQLALSNASRSWRSGLMREMVSSYEHIAEALRWCNAHDNTPQRAHTLCALLWTVVHQAHADDVLTLCRQTLERWPNGTTPEADQAVAAAATAEYVTGHPDRARDLATHTLDAMTTPGIASVMLCRVLGQARHALHDTAGALDALRAGAKIGHELGMTAMALELEIAAAQIMADDGDIDRSVEQLSAVIDRAAATGSAITEIWARTTLGWVLLRVDSLAAVAEIESALAEALRLDYPIAVAVNLRSLAYSFVLRGDLVAAAATVSALVDDLVQRGALGNARLLLDVTAAVAYRQQRPGWAALAATAAVLPITTLASAHYELIPLPSTDAPALGRHDAVGAVRQMLTEIVSAVDDGSTNPSDVGALSEPRWSGSIRRRGDVCEIEFNGQATTVRVTKGVQDLIRIVEAAGREVHCLDLVGAGVEQASTGEVIDARARRQYEDRIRELQSDIDEAERNGDFGRTYRLQVEFDAIVDHLTASLGHGRQTRRAAGTAEKARSAVTHRIRSTIRQLGKLHPPLGAHLTHAINTGIYCSYRPELETTWTIESAGPADRGSSVVDDRSSHIN